VAINPANPGKTRNGEALLAGQGAIIGLIIVETSKAHNASVSRLAKESS
jgi:hypothetical protein